ATSQAVWTTGRRPGVDRATSGSDGRYRLLRLDPEEAHHLRVEHPGYAPADVELVAPVAGAGRPGFDVTLVRGTRAHGLVFSTDGRPLAGAVARLVPVRHATPRRGPQPPRRTGDDSAELRGTTDADGRFAVEHLLPGRYDLLVTASGHAPLRVPGVEVPAPPEDGDLGTVSLEPGAEITGRVVDAEGRPLAGVEIRRFERDALYGRLALPGADEAAPLTTAEDGRFVIADLAAGAVVDLMFDAPGYTQETVSGVTAPPERPLTVELTATAIVAGRVVDGFGDGLAGITVQAMPDEAGPGGRRRFDARVAFARTDDDGRFEIENVPPGAVRLAASGGGFRPGEASGIELAPGERRDGVRIELQRGGTLVGRVLAPDGQPLPNALVQVSANLLWGGIEGRTDGDGRYRLPGLPEGVLQVRAEHSDFVATIREITAGEGEIQLDLQLGAGHRVSGRVVDAGGAPIAGARVMLGGQMVRGLLRPATTRADGSFELDGVAPGLWQLSAAKEGWVQAEEPLRLEIDGPVAGVELRLTAGAAVVGHVRGVDLAEIGRLRVAAGAEDRAPGGDTRIGTVDYEGGYRVDGLTPGRWRVMAILGEGEGMASGVVELAAGQQEARLDLEMAGDLVLSGRVTLGGRPLSGSEVSLTGRDHVSFARGRTGADGRFRIARLERGRYELSVHDYVEGVAEQREIDLAGDHEVTIDLDAGEVAGRVVDADTGAPLADAELQLRAGRGSFGDAIASHTRSRAPDGGFRLRGVAAGSYRLHARREGYGTADVEVGVPPGGTIEGVEVALPPAAGAVIEVRGARGLPPGRVMVAALAAATAPDPPPDRLTIPAAGGFFAPGEGGRVHLTALPAGRWRVHVAAPGFAVAAVDLEAPGPPVPVTLGPEAVVDVRVPELAETVEAGRVRLLGADGRPLLVPGYGGSAELGRRLQLGRARLQNVPAGAWTVEVVADDGRAWTRPVTAVAGAATEVVVE
ncbi:MAG TPA: carboxypeptidase-like regulatory domain-containing protein, partial [Thermoanaerobaculia bacterium]